MVAVLAGAKEDIVVDEVHQTETIGDLNDKIDNGYNEKEPDEIKMSWKTVQQFLELIGELGNMILQDLTRFAIQAKGPDGK